MEITGKNENNNKINLKNRKMRKRKQIIEIKERSLVAYVVLILLMQIMFIQSAAAALYTSNKTTISSGGGNITGTDYATDITVSQIAGNTSSTNFEAQFGFFYAVKTNAPVCSTIPNQELTQGHSKTIDLSYYISDIDNDNLTFSNTAVEGITININQRTGVATLTTDSLETRYVIFSASDYAETTECNNVTLTVTAAATTSPPGGVATGASASPSDFTIASPSGFSIGTDSFHIKLVQGQTQRKLLTIKNTGDIQLPFTINTEEMQNFVSVDESKFSLPPSQEKTIKLDFFALEEAVPGAYTGKISVRGSTKTRIINIIIDVKAKEALFDVIADIFQEDKEVKAGEPLKTNITLLNLGDLRGIDVKLDFEIMDMDGNVISSKHETIGVVGETLSFTKDFSTKKLKDGQYVMSIKLTFGDSVATSSELFTVKGTIDPLYKRALSSAKSFASFSISIAKERPLFVIGLIVGSIALFMATLQIAKKMRKRKKHKVELLKV